MALVNADDTRRHAARMRRARGLYGAAATAALRGQKHLKKEKESDDASTE